MRKLKTITTLLLALALFNCSSDGGDDSPGPIDIDKSGNLLGTGDSARDLLTNENFNSLLIEVAYVQSFRPTVEAMDNFVIFLRDRTFKEDIQVIYRELESPNENDLSLEEIAELEDENRTAYNDGNTLAVYIYFADAPSEGDDLDEGEVTLGAVYRNTSMIIYEQTIRTLANQSNQITTADVETTTLNHEFGHLFGLVDLGTPEVNPHEDTEAANHCNVPGCLMQAQLEFGSVMMSKLEEMAAKGIAVLELDHECVLDLQNNGGK